MDVLAILLTLCILGLIAAMLILAISSNAQTNGRPSLGGRPPLTSSESTARYRTEDGACDYFFRFKQQPGGVFRIYILDQPSYDGRCEDSPSTHRLHDSEGAYVCWFAPIPSYEDAKRIAALWAEATQQYRKTGKRF